MIVKSKIIELNDWLFLEEIPDQYDSAKPLEEKRIDIDNELIKMQNYLLSTSGLFILHTKMVSHQPVQIQTEIIGEAITSQFIFYKKADNKLSTGASRHNIRYIPSIKNNHTVQVGIEYTYFIAVISKEYYLNLIKKDSILHQDFLKKIEKGEYTSFAEKDLGATFEMQHTIQELISSKKYGEIRRLQTESRILELLMYQFEQNNETAGEKKPVLDEQDQRKLEKARLILENNLANPPTQKELALQVTMSESKLRKDFKIYFEVTIHEYLTKIRMENAKLSLIETSKSVFEIAQMVGFEHQNNFSSAFKKYYGVSPIEFRLHHSFPKSE